eukprot:jgi/Hompol1/5404/HPOL_004390-RA
MTILSKGCGDAACDHKLCASCSSGPRLTPDAAAVMAVQLASRPRPLFCPRVPLEPLVAFPETLAMSPFASPTSSPQISPRHSRTTSAQDIGPTAHSSIASIASMGSSTIPQSPLAAALSPVSSTISRQGSRELSSCGSPPISRPFLQSMLSSNAFSSLFQQPGGRSDDLARLDSRSRSLSNCNERPTGAAAMADSSGTSQFGAQHEPQPEKSSLFIDIPGLISSASAAFWGPKAVELPFSPPAPPSTLASRFAATDSNNSSPSIDQRSLDNPPESQDIDDDDEPQLSLAHLTFNLLELAVQTYVSTSPITTSSETTASTSIQSQSQTPSFGVAGDPTFLINTLRSVFSSVEPLSQSFKMEPGAKQANSSRLDIPSIRKAYALILELKPLDTFRTVLVNALELLLAKLLLNIPKLRNAGPDLMRVLLILLENPLLLDSRYDDSLLKKLCVVMGTLRSKSKVTLIKWISEYDTPGFESIVKVFQKFILNHAQSTSTTADEALIGATKVLSLLSHANDYAPTMITPSSAFYMPGLAQKLNFKEEYRIWKRTLESQRIAEFSFFNYPFLFDPVAKTRIMHIDARVQMSHVFEDAFVNQALVQSAQRLLNNSPTVSNLDNDVKRATNPYLVLEVRRERLVDDVLDQIRKKESDLKKPFKVRFVGGGEEGQDQGGVQKEFFQVIVNKLLDPGYGMFVYMEETRSSWISGVSLEPERQFELVGIIIGLALYNGVMLGIRFPMLIYKKLLDIAPTFDDFKDAFPSLGRGLQQLLDWSDGDVADVFFRNFEISYEVYGQVKTYPLIAKGEDIPVTNENRAEYVRLYVEHYTDVSIRKQFKAFQRGFHKVVGGQALKMCKAEELELLICGNTTTEMDFGELQRCAEYDGFEPDHQLIVWFWEIVHAMDLEQKKQLLNFVTASDRVPLNGLGKLMFLIQRNGPDTDRLPTALTCFGRLLLPEYSSKEKLQN